MRDDKYVLPGTNKLLIDFLSGPEKLYLLELTKDLLINIGWNPFVRNGIWDAMSWQMHTYLNQNPVIYDLAINNTLMTLGKPPSDY